MNKEEGSYTPQVILLTANKIYNIGNGWFPMGNHPFP